MSSLTQDEIQRNSFINKSEYKHLLVKSIAELSRLSQLKQSQATSSSMMPSLESMKHDNFFILSMDTEALEYVEKLILDLFNVILIVDDYFGRKMTRVDNSFSDAVSDVASSV